jgi:hypothetical protein
MNCAKIRFSENFVVRASLHLQSEASLWDLRRRCKSQYGSYPRRLTEPKIIVSSNFSSPDYSPEPATGKFLAEMSLEW